MRRGRKILVSMRTSDRGQALNVEFISTGFVISVSRPNPDNSDIKKLSKIGR